MTDLGPSTSEVGWGTTGRRKPRQGRTEKGVREAVRAKESQAISDTPPPAPRGLEPSGLGRPQRVRPKCPRPNLSFWGSERGRAPRTRFSLTKRFARRDNPNADWGREAAAGVQVGSRSHLPAGGFGIAVSMQATPTSSEGRPMDQTDNQRHAAPCTSRSRAVRPRPSSEGTTKPLGRTCVSGAVNVAAHHAPGFP
jgi:hypothetical protein